MMHLIVIEDKNCKEEFDGFIGLHDKSIHLNVEVDGISDRLQGFLSNINSIYAYDKKLAINTSDSLMLVNVGDIVRCESRRNYTVIHFSNKKDLLVARTLREFEEILGPYNFFRVHRSHLVNVNCIDKYVKSKGFVLLKNGEQIHFSQSKRESFFKLLEKL
ncbi:MAG: LytTR family transcriptional regulator DNA-binding domain-containing protein [Flavobacteriales bacterium]|nr:LytTR family transcriptional regulator DNA-binding domain-containing protein [Flavobacteriales bacterium]